MEISGKPLLSIELRWYTEKYKSYIAPVPIYAWSPAISAG